MRKILTLLCACGVGMFTLAADVVPSDQPSASTSFISSVSISSEVTSQNSSSETTSSSIVIEEEKQGTVIVEDAQHGEIFADKESGKVGETVNIIVQPNFLYKVESVTVNGVSLTPVEEDKYSFVLQEGENVVTATFVISEEDLTYIAEILENAKNGDWTSIFSVENLLTIITWIITTLLSSGFLITLIKNKKIKAATTNEINENVQKTVTDSISTFLDEKMSAIVKQYNLRVDEIYDICKILTRCFILSQSDTPESRLQIMDELTKLKATDKELTNKVKEIINNEILQKAEAIKERDESIEELKKMNDEIKTDESNKSETNDDLGSF